MTFLLFSIRDTKYALPAQHVVEVIPNILKTKKNSPRSPEYFAGHINYYDTLLPVVDLCQLHAGTPCINNLSSRIILIKYQRDGGSNETIGLLAEKVTETMRVLNNKKNIIHSKAGMSYILPEDREQSDRIEIFDLARMLPDNFDIFCLR